MAQENQQGSLSGWVPSQIPGLEANATLKFEWPEVVGMLAEEAEAKIKQDIAGVHVQVIPADHFVTMDYNQGRVRIFADASGKVAKTPMIG